METALAKRRRMMGELAASLSHEITQPIASARNNARAAQNFLDMNADDDLIIGRTRCGLEQFPKAPSHSCIPLIGRIESEV